ncbi:uncharacterized protein BDW43DRAFT_121633 [Aspergillus alliaceus]|uniref:uncharacterized protein n=1 Tax=Petromyces alliaceus TaxID=209559 RepID=UPI0012A54DA1|nr:uncharacterized protein BDW43DRAFT_121633 [Aspergillus alliaceus]KAB8238675.1 hypothetical protein BDW43DRAFT_121633 [Aspergillus alliaceus]
MARLCIPGFLSMRAGLLHDSRHSWPLVHSPVVLSTVRTLLLHSAPLLRYAKVPRGTPVDHYHQSTGAHQASNPSYTYDSCSKGDCASRRWSLSNLFQAVRRWRRSAFVSAKPRSSPSPRWIELPDHIFGVSSWFGHLQGWGVTPLSEPDADGDLKYTTSRGSDSYEMLISHDTGPCDGQKCAWNAQGHIWWRHSM